MAAQDVMTGPGRVLDSSPKVRAAKIIAARTLAAVLVLAGLLSGPEANQGLLGIIPPDERTHVVLVAGLILAWLPRVMASRTGPSLIKTEMVQEVTTP